MKHGSKDHKPISGVTEVLSKKQEEIQGDVQIIVNKSGVEETVKFLEERLIIGRNSSGVHYTDATEGISRVHCEFVKSGDAIEIRDLGSLNGSYLNGKLLTPYKSYPFRNGDLLKIVTTEIRLSS
jgi:pSer/pThr/pTyr-binding forkhead associated (FHA) protein